VEEERRRYCQERLQKFAKRPLLSEQKRILNRIRQAIDGDSNEMMQNLFFLHRKPGRWKTYLLNTISARLRSKGHIVTIASPSAKGAVAYMGGLTCHKTFGIPLFDKHDGTMLQPLWGKGQRNAEILRLSTMIIAE